MRNTIKILEFGSSEEKILALESLQDAGDGLIISEIISRLNDEDIRVRGEAFGTLVSNRNEISQYLIQGLSSASKNIRGYTALVLANRKESDAVRHIAKLVEDRHSMVRACALGALGHLKAKSEGDTICKCLTDPDLEVKKSALSAAIQTGKQLSDEVISSILQQKDCEVEKLVMLARRVQT